jgi:hypothetical protein
VTATAPNGHVTTAVENRSGVYVFLRLPGVREEPLGNDDDYFANPPAPVIFTIDVSDPQGRFLPARFSAACPVAGLFSLAGIPLEYPSRQLPLFSTPWRTPPSGFAVIRAELHDLVADQPAAWAILEIVNSASPLSVIARGLTDEQGRVCLFFPYPEINDTIVESLPHAVRRLTDESWTLDIALRYEPGAAPAEPGSPPRLDLLFAQRHGTALAAESPPVPLAALTLLYGQDLVLKSTGSPPPSVLFAQPFV